MKGGPRHYSVRNNANKTRYPNWKDSEKKTCSYQQQKTGLRVKIMKRFPISRRILHTVVQS
jgi:hypothetical protein